MGQEHFAHPDAWETEMNKVTGLIVVVAAVALGAWYFTRTPEGQKAGDAAMSTAQDSATAATDAAKDAATATKDAATQAVDATKDAAQKAGEAVGNAVDATKQAVGDAATSATDAAKSAGEAVSNAASDAATSAGDMLENAKALTVENFNADKVEAMIDASQLADDTKATLKSAVEAARNSPEKVAEVVAQVKAALGM